MTHIYKTLVLAGSVCLLSSCIYESPDNHCNFSVNLKVVCDTEWLPDSNMVITRGDNLALRYQFKIYREDNSEFVKEVTVFSDDLERNDFNIQLDLQEGNYLVYGWSDYCDATTGNPLYYNSSNFEEITYLQPYTGDTNLRDAFRGTTTIEIGDNDSPSTAVNSEIIMTRPLARYIFKATDVDEFLTAQISQGKLSSKAGQSGDNIFDGYTVKVVYPLFMPAVFDNFTNSPINSWSGISFTGNISMTNEHEAQLALDYVMVKEGEGSVQVAVEIYNPEGTLVSGSGTLTLPLLRDRTTIVSGEFLTSNIEEGVIVDPNFDGKFNIEVK